MFVIQYYMLYLNMLVGKLARSCKDFISQQFNSANLPAYYPNKITNAQIKDDTAGTKRNVL